MLCDIPNITKEFEKLISKGVPVDTAEIIIRGKLRAASNPVSEKVLNELFPKPIAQELTEDEKNELADIWDTIATRFSTPSRDFYVEFLDSIGKADLRETFGLIVGDKQQRLFELVKKSGLDIENYQVVQYQHINRINELITAHQKLGNEEFVKDLQDVLLKEQTKLEQRKENANNLGEKIKEREIKAAVIKSLLAIAEKIDISIVTETEKAFKTDLEELLSKVEKYVETAKNLRAKLDRAYTAWKAADPTRRSKLRETYYKLKKELTPKIKEATKEGAKLVQESDKKRLEFISKTYKDRLGKSLGARDKTFSEVIFRLEQELNKIQGEMVNLSLRAVAQDTTNLTRSTSEIITHQTRMRTVAEAGAKMRVDNFIARLDTENAPTLQELTETFGEPAYNMIVNQRDLIKLADGSETKDLTSPNKKEIIAAGRLWKNLMMQTATAGFYSEDPADITEEAINLIETIAMGRTIVDSSSPEAIDPSFAPANTAEDRLAMATPGVIPDYNRFKTEDEAVRALEGTIRRLYSVFGFKHFNGIIPEKLIRQVLDPKLMDINPKAWQSAQISYLKSKPFNDIQTQDQINLRRGMILSHGGNPDIMPEFNDPLWFGDNSKLISFDIETFGNIYHPTDKVDGVYSIQIKMKDGIHPPQTKILVNSGGVLVDAKSVITSDRDPITKDQLTKFMGDLENFQNEGFKVITHNGNNFDFPQLKKHVNDVDLLARVAIRSIDLLANITSAVPGRTWHQKQKTKGKKLKEMAKANLPESTPRTAYDGRVQFTSGYPIDLTTGTEIKLSSDGIKPLWDEAKASGEWYRFDAYSENDADITIDLFEHMFNSKTSELKLISEGSVSPSIISVGKPLSNLFLNNDTTHISGDSLENSLGDLKNITPQMTDQIESALYTEAGGYDAHKVLDIFTGWWLKALMGNEIKYGRKLEQIKQALATKAEKEVLFDTILVNIAGKNRNAIGPLLKKKFDKYGFVLTLNYKTDGVTDGLVEINDESDPTTGNFKIEGTFNESILYSQRVSDPERYENAVLKSFLETINNPKIKHRFRKALETRVNARKRLEDETDAEYWNSVIKDYLRPLIPGFFTLADFGNSNVDWKPADEVGIAIAQVMMDQKPGMTVSDVLIHNGHSIEEIFQIDEQAQFKSQGSLGRRKELAVLDPLDVNMAQPHALSKEEAAYDGFRLIQRVNHLLDMNIDLTMESDIEAWLRKPIKQEEGDAIASIVNEQILSIVPDVAARGVFTSIPSLAEKKRITEEHLYNIPKLLMSINHDCFYIGIGQPQRFLNEDLPVFFFNDAINPGGPTGAALMGGAMDQLAWMINFGMVTDQEFNTILGSVERGIELLRREGPNAIAIGNKTDYAFQGKHNILAMMLAMQDGNLNLVNDILAKFGATDGMGSVATLESEKIIVNKKDLGDPRFKVYDLLFGYKERQADGTEKTIDGIFPDMLDNPDKYKLTIEEHNSLKSIGPKLNSIATDRTKLKEFFKGAITPRMYQAGLPGITKGLSDKNAANDLGFTEEEIDSLATVLLRANMIENMSIIDAALGFSSTDIKELKTILLNYKQKLSADKLRAYIGSSATKAAKDKAARLNSLKGWYSKSLDQVSDSLARFKGISPIDVRRKTEVETEKEKIKKDWETRLTKASEIWNTRAVEDMSTDEYHTLMYDLNVVLAGGKEALENQLMLYALRRRAATPYVIEEDAIDLQQLVSTPHISKEDYQRWLNKEIFFRYGVEAASGRNHMVGWYGIGPEGSKYAQPRVVAPKDSIDVERDLFKKEMGSDYNPFGLWDIKEITSKTTRDMDTLFLRSVMIDLARFYKPPVFTGYPMMAESREMYFKAVEERSAREIEAQEKAQYLDSFADEHEFTINGETITNKERKVRNRKLSGTVGQRVRMRTKLSGTGNESLVLDAKIDGIGALRPNYADIDFTQRGIYALAQAQHRARIRNNESLTLAKTLDKPDTFGPNDFVDKSLRGFVSPWDKDTMPYIPQSSEDIGALVALGSKNAIEVKAVQLQNTLEAFAKENNLEDLVARGDWTRLFVIKRIKEKALYPTLSTLRKIQKPSPTSTSLDRMLPIKEARVKFHDGLIKVAGINSIALSGNHKFSVTDLMASLDERALSIEDINEINSLYGEEPGWIQVLTWLATKGKVSRLMPLKFGLTIDAGVIARGKEGRQGIRGTSLIPITSFGFEIMQVYHFIQSTEIARKIATRLVPGSALDTPAVKKDSNGFIILESLNPLLDTKLYNQILQETMQNKAELTKQLMTTFTFVLDRSQTLRIMTNADQVYREDETEESLTRQGITNANVFTQKLVDNPGTLWLFTPDMVTDMLNEISNNKFFSEFTLGYQTKKELYQIKSDADILAQEEQAQMFEKMREDEEDMNDALLMLHKLNPGKAKPIIISDYSKTDLNGNPRLVIDFGAYMVNEAYYRGSQAKDVAEGSSNNVKVNLLVSRDGTTELKKTSVTIPTADMPYVSTLINVINKARASGFHEQADKISDFVEKYGRIEKETDPKELIVKKKFKGVRTSNVVLKLAAMSFELAGNTEAQEALFTYFGFSSPEEVKTLKTKLAPVLDAMLYTTSVERHEVDSAYYITKAKLERQDFVDKNLSRDSVFVSEISRLTNKPDSRELRISIMKATDEVIQPMVEPEIASDLFKITASPAVFADPDSFMDSFADPGDRAIAEKIVANLDQLVADGIISARVRDMKLMLIGKLSQNNMEFIRNLGFEAYSSDSEPLMSASKRNGKYILGLNIKLAELTNETEMVFRFAEELLHIARVKFVSQNSQEWNNVVGLFSANRSRGMVREMLIAMSGKMPTEELESKVNYAMSNPDEFFAHVGAFVLLKDLFGNSETLDTLAARFQGIAAATSLWKRAFFMIKGMAKNILTTFAKLTNDPNYSDLYQEAEKAVMGVIENGFVARGDVGNPDAVYNTYKNSATTLNNKVISPVEQSQITILTSEIQALETLRNAEVAKDVATRDTVLINKLNNDIETKTKDRRALDAITFMGISRTEVSEKMQDLTAWQAKSKRRITESEMLRQGNRRAFISHFVTKGIERRGNRVDTPFTLAGIFRNSWLSGPLGEKIISGVIQNGALNALTATELTWNSPFAPMVVIADLLDHTAATTSGSFKSNVGGIANQKHQIDVYAHNVLRTWGEISSEYTKPEKQLQIVTSVIEALTLKKTPTTTDKKEYDYILKLSEAIKLMRDRMVELMNENQLLEPGEDLKVDEFPIKLRNFSLLSEEQREVGYTEIRKALMDKQRSLLKHNGENSPFSSLVLFTSGSLPYLLPTEKMSPTDANFIEIVKNDIKSGTATVVTSGRQALINHLIRKIADKGVKTGTYSKISVYADNSSEAIMNDIQDELYSVCYMTREGNVTMNKAFAGMTTQNMEVLLKDYTDAIEHKTVDSKTKEKFDSIKSNEQAMSLFNIPTQAIGILPQAFDTMGSNDVLAIEFLSKVGVSSHLFRKDAFHLNAEDVFVNGSVELKQLFDWHIDSAFKSLARGTGYDLVERILLQELSGIPGAYFNIAQLLNMLEAETNSTGVEAANFHLLDASGTPIDNTRSKVLMQHAIERARLAHKEIRGTLTNDDLDLGSTMSKVNSAAKQLVAFRYGVNINFATALVEAPNGVLAAMSSGDNIINSLLNIIAFGGVAVEQYLRGFGWNLYDKLPQKADGGPMWSFKKGILAGYKFSPLRERKLNELAASALWTTEEALSPMLPQNLNHSDATSDLVEKLGWWERSLLRRSRSNSNVMRSVRIAAGAVANRNIVKLVRSGKLQKFRAEYIKSKPTTVAGIIAVADSVKVSIDQEVLISIVRSGLLEKNVLEAIQTVYQNYGTYRGTVLDQSMSALETDLHFGRSPIRVNKLGARESEIAIKQARMAMARFMDLDISRTMVTRKPMDAPVSNDFARNLLTFYKSYPALWVSQQLLRRGSVASPWKLAIHIFLTGLLDLIYNIVLGLARGSLSYKDVLEQLEDPSSTKTSDLVRYVLRHPVFTNNPVGLAANSTLQAATGRGSAAISAVTEGALQTQVKDLGKLGAALLGNEARDQSTSALLYKALGPLLPEELYSIPVRLMAMQAYGDATPYSSPGTKNSTVGRVMQMQDNYYNGDAAAVFRALIPRYEETMQKRSVYDRVKTNANQLQQLHQKPNIQVPTQVPTPVTTTPPVPTQTRVPTLVEQATQPIKAPM
jgi:hypothetical protein